MLKRWAVLTMMSGILVLCIGEAAWATIDNFKTFKQTYPGKDPKFYSCKVCHQSAIGKKGDLNAYGLALQHLKAPADAKKLTEEDLRAIEKDDADGDGASNLDEINAGTAPGDPVSVPAGLKPKGQDGEQGSGEQKKLEKQHGKDSSSLTPGLLERLQAYLEQLSTPDVWAAKSEPSRGKAGTPEESPKAEYVGMETCAACHAKQYREFQHSTHARIAIPDEHIKAQGCETCHGPGSLHVAAGGGRGVGGIINPRKDPSTCFACHLDKKAEFRLPYHHPVMEGKMSCADCHSPHAPDVRPWSSTTQKDINEACFRCHKEQRGPFVWEHEALREGCITCHKVHGSIHEKMLLVRDNNLCLRCHTQVNFPTIGKSSHAGRLPQGTCFSAGCHTAVHGSNFDDHLRY